MEPRESVPGKGESIPQKERDTVMQLDVLKYSQTKWAKLSLHASAATSLLVSSFGMSMFITFPQ